MDTVKLLENNVRELQKQLVEANKRILDLNDRLNESLKEIEKQQEHLAELQLKLKNSIIEKIDESI